LSFEKEVLTKSNNKSHTIIEILEKEKEELQSKHDLEKVILKFTKGQDSLDKLLGSQRMSFNKEGIGYNPFNKKKTYKNFFVHETSKNKSHTTCNYCPKNGHVSYSCPFKKSSPRLVQIWVPKGVRPPT